MMLKTDYYIQIQKDFTTHIRATKSIKSGDHYSSQAEEFLLYLENRQVKHLDKVTNNLMGEYYDQLSSRPKKRGEGKISLRTLNDNMSTLRMLSKRMLEGKQITKALPVPANVKIENDDTKSEFGLVREILTTDEVREVYQSCNTNIERAIIALAYGCGMRRSELADLVDFQINYAKGTVTPTKTKNNKTRTIPVSDYFLKVLKTYSMERLKIQRNCGAGDAHFFLKPNGHKYSGASLNRMLKKVIERTCNQEIIDKKITLHCLRHSIATHLLDAGQTYDYVRQFLGHSFVDTSSIYAKRRKIKNYYTI